MALKRFVSVFPDTFYISERGRDYVGVVREQQEKGRLLVTMKRPDNGLPEDIREHMKLICDVVALAFQTDKTRFATLL